MGDATMADGDEDVLRIRIFDYRPDEAIDVERKKTSTKFDTMIERGSMEPLVALVKGTIRAIYCRDIEHPPRK
jgi:hypothetical protein